LANRTPAEKKAATAAKRAETMDKRTPAQVAATKEAQSAASLETWEKRRASVVDMANWKKAHAHGLKMFHDNPAKHALWIKRISTSMKRWWVICKSNSAYYDEWYVFCSMFFLTHPCF